MKSIFNMRNVGRLMLTMAISVLAVSCLKEEIVESPMTYGGSIQFRMSSKGAEVHPDTKSGVAVPESYVIAGDGISATVTVVDGIESKGNEPMTKGAQATTVSAFDVAAYLYPEGATTGLDYFADIVSDGVNPAQERYWPEFGTLDFLAAAPTGLIASMPSVSDYENGFSFNYTIPSNVTEQQDIMVAVANEQNNSATGAPVPLHFQHLLAAVQFKVGDMQFIKINSLKLTGIRGGEIKFVYDSDNKVWTPDMTSATTVSYDLTTLLPNTSGFAKGDDITGNRYNSMLLVAPQTLSGAKIEVNYTETITDLTSTKTAALSGEWKAGMTTAYALNIVGTNFGTVEIPRPEDQDAHYIMLEMSYNMGNILNSDKIKSVKATAQWKDNSGNTSTKSGISLKFSSELTEIQKQGFWTDKRYKQTITVTNSGSTSSAITEDKTHDSHGNTGLKGGSYLNITNSTGKIVLFIEENNGTTDREGELIFTATLATGKEIILGEGAFKQLCPCWNEYGIGVERIEESNFNYSYGFSYDRKVTYENSGFYIGIGLIRSYYSSILENRISDDDGNFVTVTPGESWIMEWKIQTVVLDYSALNGVNSVASNEDGLINTVNLYNFTGGNDVAQLEKDLDQYDGQYLSKTINSEGLETPDDYAAFVALSRNRMYELETTITSSEGTDIVSKAVLYKEGNNNVVEWYLPSSVEATKLVETGKDNTGNVSSVIDNLNGTYWSSTAGDDLTPAKSYTYTYSANAYQNTAQMNRTSKYKVRAVRKKPTAN